MRFFIERPPPQQVCVFSVCVKNQHTWPSFRAVISKEQFTTASRCYYLAVQTNSCVYIPVNTKMSLDIEFNVCVRSKCYSPIWKQRQRNIDICCLVMLMQDRCLIFRTTYKLVFMDIVTALLISWAHMSSRGKLAVGNSGQVGNFFQAKVFKIIKFLNLKSAFF